MIEKKFNDNTQFIIPLIIKNRDLCNNKAFFSSEITTCAGTKFLILKFRPNTCKFRSWLYINLRKENAFFSAMDSDDEYCTLIAKFLIPSNFIMFIEDIQINGSYFLTNRNIVDIMYFWGDLGKEFFEL